MGIKRGTVLGVTGIAGALIEDTIGLAGAVIADVFGIAVPTAGGWLLGCLLGVVVGDALTVLLGKDVSLGRWAGIKKGLIASGVAAVGYYASTTGLASDVLEEYLRTLPLSPAEVVKIGSIWLGAVLGDFFDA